jgi:threonine dehydratase
MPILFRRGGEHAGEPSGKESPVITLDEIRAARERLSGIALRTPLVRLELEEAPAEVWLKLETLQPIGSFKLRGAANAMAMAPTGGLAQGVWTASAGNMAQGVAWEARRRGIRCAVLAPDHAPATKLAAIERLGASVVKVPFAEWFEVLARRTHPAMSGYFVHPVSDPAVIAGNGTIGLEILEDLPEVDAIVVPYGGGGLSSGIATAAKALKPGVRVFAAEVETSAALAAALTAGQPVRIEYRASFVDGIGSPFVLDEMWPLARRLLDGSRVSSLERVAAAIRILIERARVVAEGAGAAAVAAALGGGAGNGKVACVVSGGNIDAMKLAAILEGRLP